MKRQTGVRVDVEVWDGYKSVCTREELRPNEGVEGFLRVVLEDGSVLRVLRLLQRAVRARIESLDDYAHVLLTWYKRGERLVYSEDRQVSLDTMLLSVLRNVSDPRLRSKIRRVLTAKHDDEKGSIDTVEEPEDEEQDDELVEAAPSSVAELVDGMAKRVVGLKLSAAEKRKILQKIRDIRECMVRG